MAKFFYARTKKIVEIPDDLAEDYDGRRWYSRLPEPLTVPDGSVAEVLAWVGDDIDRANAALEAEEAGKRRKGILKALG